MSRQKLGICDAEHASKRQKKKKKKGGGGGCRHLGSSNELENKRRNQKWFNMQEIYQGTPVHPSKANGPVSFLGVSGLSSDASERESAPDGSCVGRV